jgi:hypothetical protein
MYSPSYKINMLYLPYIRPFDKNFDLIFKNYSLLYHLIEHVDLNNVIELQYQESDKIYYQMYIEK